MRPQNPGPATEDFIRLGNQLSLNICKIRTPSFVVDLATRLKGLYLSSVAFLIQDKQLLLSESIREVLTLWDSHSQA